MKNSIIINILAWKFNLFVIVIDQYSIKTPIRI